MLRKTVMLLASTLVLSTSTTWALQANRHSGQSCQASTGTHRGIIYNSAGAQNNSTGSTLEFYCPNAWTGIDNGAGRDSITAVVYYHDRSSTHSLSCRFELVVQTPGTDSDNPIVGSTVHSCASTGGCSDPNPSYSKKTFNTLTLSLSPHPTLFPLSWAIRCTIPPRLKGGNSGILSYDIRHEPVGLAAQ
jgi:hypothetical protein